jgi:hypothetical protein
MTDMDMEILYAELISRACEEPSKPWTDYETGGDSGKHEGAHAYLSQKAIELALTRYDGLVTYPGETEERIPFEGANYDGTLERARPTPFGALVKVVGCFIDAFLQFQLGPVMEFISDTKDAQLRGILDLGVLMGARLGIAWERGKLDDWNKHCFGPFADWRVANDNEEEPE